MAKSDHQPKLTPIKSSALNAYHYDPDSRQLTVEFSSGARHQYDDVPHEKIEAFTGAASPGSFFSSRIRDNYLSRKL